MWLCDKRVLILFWFHVLVIVACKKRQHEKVIAVLDKNSTHKFDVYVRRELLFLILGKINETNNVQLSSCVSCESKINQTLSKCRQCITNTCSGDEYKAYQNTLAQLTPTIFKPILDVSYLIDKMGSSLSTAIDILGEESGLFMKDLAELASYLGVELMNERSQFNSVASELESLGSKLTALSKDLVLVPLNTLPDINGNIDLSQLGSGFQNLLNQVGDGFSSIGDALKDLGHKIVGGLTDAGQAITHTGEIIGNSVSNAFHSIFGRSPKAFYKRDCTNQCPYCSRIDLNSHNAMTIQSMNCGEGIINEQRNTLDQVKYLQGIYNNTLKNVLITKIEYDPSSIKTTNRIAFSTSFMTYSVQDLVDKFQSEVDFEISDLKTTAKAVAGQIWRLMN